MLLPAFTIDGIQRVVPGNGGLFTISPAVAVTTLTFSVGVAFTIWPDLFGNGWEWHVSGGEGLVVSGNRLVSFMSQGRIDEDFAFRGFNVTAGFLWAITPKLSLGGVVRTPFTARVTHTQTSSLTVTLADGSAPVTATSGPFRETLDMHLPVAYGLGVALRPSNRLILSLMSPPLV
jgi:hypothetical protein